MARRPTFPFDTPADAIRRYLADALAEKFTLPRILPLMRCPRPEPQSRAPSLFEQLPEQRRGEPPVAMPEPEPTPVPRRQPPPPGMPLHEVMAIHFAGVIAQRSELALKRQRLKEERAAAAVAREAEVAAAEPEPVTVPSLLLTKDMGHFRDAHMIDRCEVGTNGGHVVACPPFHLHDKDHVEPIDEFLGQVVGIKAARALLFRRRDPDIMDGCDVGQRYVLLRFWDDEEGQAWSMPVEDDDDAAVLTAIRTTTALYGRRWRDP